MSAGFREIPRKHTRRATRLREHGVFPPGVLPREDGAAGRGGGARQRAKKLPRRHREKLSIHQQDNNKIKGEGDVSRAYYMDAT